MELTEGAAVEALRDAGNAEEAFMLLQTWNQSSAAVAAPADRVEKALHRGGMEVMRRLLEENFRARGEGDVGQAVVRRDSEGQSERLGYRRTHQRDYESVFGTIDISRLGYGAPGQSSVHPLDEELNLPQRRYSYVVQEHGCRLAARGPFDEAVDEVGVMTAARLPKRQLEQVVADGAQDFEVFYEQRCASLPPPEQTGIIMVAGIDCKGVPRRKTPEELAEPEPAKLQKGQKRQKKKMATVASVHTTEPYVRRPEEVVENLMDPRPREPDKERPVHPRPKDRRLWASLRKSKDEVIEEVAEEMRRRDPHSHKIAVCVMDGEEALRTRAIRHLQKAFPALILILDIMHVLKYLWDAAYAFHDEGSEQARLWVRERLLAILQGQVSRVAAGIRQSATKQGLSGKERKAVDTSCNYMLKNKQRMQYDYYLKVGLPIASGAAEGACGHLVKDRMELTGASWDVYAETAEAVLKLRALDKSGDLNEYWDFHVSQEHERLYGDDWEAVA
jgi:hypothetical protein